MLDDVTVQAPHARRREDASKRWKGWKEWKRSTSPCTALIRDDSSCEQSSMKGAKIYLSRMTMTCRVQRGRSRVSGLWLIGDRAWVVRRGETEGGRSVSWYRYASPPGKIASGDKVKHRTGRLSRAEWKHERPVRR